MIIFPAVDIKDGQAVRLKKGRADEATVFSPNPIKAALHWQNLGATWLHLIDLDGAFTGEPVNLPLITTMCQTLSIPIQLGGGIRSLQTAKDYINAGIERLIIGTLALENSSLFAEMCQMFPNKIGVSLDTEKGKIKTKGWVADSGLTLEEVLPELKKQGASFLIHTDIDRDGMQTGVNLPLLSDLTCKSPIPLIAAGGVATLKDIQNLYPLSCQGNVPGNLQGVITGRAIYENTLNFSDALAWVANQK